MSQAAALDAMPFLCLDKDGSVEMVFLEVALQVPGARLGRDTVLLGRGLGGDRTWFGMLLGVVLKDIDVIRPSVQ